MKKLISLTLSIVMIMSLAVIPVHADASATASVTPTYTISSATKFMATSGTLLENYNDTPVGINLNSLVYVNGNWGLQLRIGGVYLYNEETAGDIEAWEGMKVKADSTVNVATLTPDYYQIGGNAANFSGIVTGGTSAFEGKDLRADSIRFMLPEQGDAVDAGLLLFGGNNADYSPPTSAEMPTALRILNGGAKSIDMSTGSTAWQSFIDDGTIQPNKWYRAERILDTRIDDGVGTKSSNGLLASGTWNHDGDASTPEVEWKTTTENWQRFIVYEEGAEGDTVVGDSGWVMTSRYSKGAKDFPLRNTSFVPINYPAGSYVYIDDIKAWALDTPVNNYERLTLQPKQLLMRLHPSRAIMAARDLTSLRLNIMSRVFSSILKQRNAESLHRTAMLHL